MKPSEEFEARYIKIERVTDDLGRSIGVKRLKRSEKRKILEMATSDNVNVIADMTIAAAVREIDGSPIPFPKTRAELDAITDRLDDEGVLAASMAFSKILGLDEESKSDAVELAKN
jgi:hypothetical protein